MAKGGKFASGKWAWGICDTCGIRAKLITLQVQSVMGREIHIRSCATCNDPDHPQNFLPKFVTNDPQALRDPRPDTGAYASRVLTPPGNWINGQPPTPAQLEQRQAEIEAEQERQRANWRMDMEAQRLRQRSF